jgi:hypothetical protein
MAAAAEPNRSAASKTERHPLRINDFEVALDANRSVAVDRNFRSGHSFLPGNVSLDRVAKQRVTRTPTVQGRAYAGKQWQRWRHYDLR